MNVSRFLLLTLPILGGCDLIQAAKEALDGLTNPVVAQGLVLGVVTPTDPDVAALLDGSDYQPGTSIEVHLAFSDGETTSPISRATVRVVADTKWDLVNEGEGSFVLEGTGAPGYTEGDRWRVKITPADADLGAGKLSVELPPAPQVDIPEESTPGMGIMATTSSPYDGLLAVVLNDKGEVTWSNEPTTLDELLDALDGDPIDTLELPAEAFPDEAIYAVGVAGVNYSTPDDVENLNTGFSFVGAGKMNFYGVSTLSIPTTIPTTLTE